MRYVLLSAMAAGLLAFTAGAASAVEPEDRSDVDVNAGPVQVRVDADRRGPAGGPDVATQDMTIRLSELTGLEVRNAQNEDLGDIDDIVIDMRTGKIRYAAVASGGFLGLGEKLLAIPFNAFQFRQTEDDKYFVLNVSEERLKEAPGFDKDNWPERGSQVWVDSDAYYKTDVRADEGRRRVRPREAQPRQ